MIKYCLNYIFKYLNLSTIVNILFIYPNYVNNKYVKYFLKYIFEYLFDELEENEYVNNKFIKYLFDELDENELRIFIKIINKFNKYYISGGFIAKYLNRTNSYNDIDIYVLANDDLDIRSDEIDFLNEYISSINKIEKSDIYYSGVYKDNISFYTFHTLNLLNTRIQIIYIRFINFDTDYEADLKPAYPNFEESLIYTLYNFDLQICQACVDYQNNLFIIQSCSLYSFKKEDKEYLTTNTLNRYKKYLKRYNKDIWNNLY